VNQRLAPHLLSFRLNHGLVGAALRALPEQAADRRLDERTHSARSIALHLVASRHSLCTLLEGRAGPLPWSRVGEGFEAGFIEGADRPRLSALLEVWERLGPAAESSLSGASDEVLARPSPLSVSGVERPTLADFAAVNVIHESYHAGQLGLLVKSITGKGLMTPAPAAASV
jgi:uncharacterized damage-inducible protein DinB